MRAMKPFALLIVTVSCFAANGLHAQFPVNPTADRVLGQPDFTSNTGPAASPSSMSIPSGVAVDPVSGKVFVSLAGHHRILRFASSAALSNGANAEAVIGQSNYTSSSAGTSATKVNSPYGIDIDAAGRLWVADYENDRVLMFADAANLPEFDAAADLVLGQSDFITGSFGLSQIKMSGPTGVHVDASGNLWVADFANHRVLMFAAAATLGDGAPATTVLGQPDFDTGSSGTSPVKMFGPVAVVVDPGGRLWVAEQTNDRVLRFDAAASLANGSPANGVLGQLDFTTGTAGSTAEKMDSPAALAIDRKGTLYIADYNNNRVTFHKNPAAKANGATPDGVIGQPDLVTVAAGISAQVLGGPYGGLDFDAAGNLWISDYNNNRAIRFPGDFTAIAPTLTGKPPKSVTGGKLSLKGTATDPNGVASVRFRVGKGPIKTAVGTTSWKLSAKLKPGKNTIEIVAVDSFGNVSPPKRVKVKRL
jgi:DNA-binding beta-propeller fold protein YncE